MTQQLERRDWIVQGLIVAQLLGVAAVDLVTSLGYSEWVLYFLPLGACLFQSRPRVALACAAAASVLSVVGFWASPEGVSFEVAVVNRLLGVVSYWVVAVVIWRALSARAELHGALWLRRAHARVAEALMGEHSVAALSQRALRTLGEETGAVLGALYRLDGATLRLDATQAADAQRIPRQIALGQGLVGAAPERGGVQLCAAPAGHLDLVSGLGRSTPGQIAVACLMAEGATVGVLELGFLDATAPLQRELELLQRCQSTVGMALRAAILRERTLALLEETQRQSEELQVQQEELQVANEEMAERTRALGEAQARLETQQAELEHSNVQLEEQTTVLGRQRDELVRIQADLMANAEQLQQANSYKSEFLANMSHELRTPLNSSLILSQLLAENKAGTLSQDEVRYARAIGDANKDLLTLINDILDLSKIESGHVELRPESVALEPFARRLKDAFEPIAAHKGLAFAVELAPGAPPALYTDGQRLQQVLKNLLSNAIKFTAAGEVRLTVSMLRDRVSFRVSDTGVGIAVDQQALVFEAFRQVDGTASRRFGGTGLGLSISRQLAGLLGGAITLESELGKGSVFTLDLPLAMDARQAEPTRVEADVPRLDPIPALAVPDIGAAGATAPRGRGRLILAIEDDARFAQALVALAHELDFDAVVASNAREGQAMARELAPNGILLDLGLPDESGLALLHRLKADPDTRHIPVHIVSAMDPTQPAFELGAIGYVRKPASRDALKAALGRIEQRLQRDVRRLLLVEDDAGLRESLTRLLGEERLEIVAVGSVAQAREALATQTFDCMVTDLNLPDGTGDDLLEQMASMENVAFPPVIVYTGRMLTREEEQRLRRHSQSIIVKGARSPERLLDEVTLFLHSVESSLPPERQRMLRQARRRDAVLDGRRLLLAEDDVRNIFALTSVFEPLGATLEIARNGREAVERAQRGDIDLVLMDIMMPEMDGLEAIRKIREQPALRDLPIIALTAKAMPEDRERCLEAGANDYVAKPIDIEKLLSLCHVWCRQ